jgi:N-acetylglucosaminyl-diphospho-decaprenol L-rhamnosyltransferase
MTVVLLISYSGLLGGAERMLLGFATGLDGEICLACPDGQLAGEARAQGIRVFPLRSRRLNVRATLEDRLSALPRLTAHALEARALVHDLDPDLVVACGMRSAIALLVANRPRPPVVFLHNDMLTGRIVGRMARRAASRADLVIVPSHAVADDLGADVYPMVVRPGIDVARFENRTAPADPPEVLVLGALVGWKRPDLALEACALARRHRPDLRVRFVGAPLDGDSGGLMEQLRERASSPDLAGAVEFAGAVADPREDLARASFLLHCAPREPFGVAVIEALATGRPAVVPASAGPAEIADRSCAILYRPGDAPAAANAIIELLDDPERAQRMGEHGRVRVRADFDRSATRERFAEAVTPLMRDRSVDGDSRAMLALLTVTHNSAPQLDALLRSTERHLPGVRVVVVDCASSDDTLAVASQFASAVTLALPDNVGFSRACNRGMAEIGEPVTALVNPDLELLDDSLLALAAEASRQDRPERLLAPLVLSPDGSRQDTVHPRPGTGAGLARAIIPPTLAPGRLGTSLAPWRSRGCKPVGWAVGCALAARTETLRRLGPFDERIFLFAEDLELGLRASEHGVETWFWPKARVLHHGAHSTAREFGGEPFELLARARHEVLTRRLGTRRARLDDAAQALTFASRIAVKRTMGRSADRERRQLAALARVWRGPG